MKPQVSGTPSDSTAAVILAGGAGSRFHGSGHKLTAELDGTSLLARAIRSALLAQIGPVIVVTGANERVDHIGPEHPEIHVVHNPRWAEGQITSVHAGIDHAAELGAQAVVIGLADQPFVVPAAWRAVAGSTARIAVATYDGVRGNPVRLHRSVWLLLPTSGDEGARSLIRLHPELVEPVPCPGSPADIDTLEDLQRWQNSSSTNSP